MFGGLAVITDYPIEAPYDDAMTYSLTLEGMGALVDLSADPVSPDTMPDSVSSIEPLTVVSVEGSSTGQTMIYANPTLTASNKYYYKTGVAPLGYPAYMEDVTTGYTAWDGESAITATTGNELLLVETDSTGHALKTGKAIVTSKGA